jgi:hypothetical protein
MNRSVLLMLAVSLGGCDVSSKNPANSDANVTIKGDAGGNVAFNLPFVKGEVQVPSGFMHEGNLDIDGVKLMPGSKVTGFSVFAADKGSTVKMAFAAPASPDQVRAYFADQFKQKGVEVASAGDAISGRSKDGDPFVIRVSPAAQGSQGTIDIQSKD